MKIIDDQELLEKQTGISQEYRTRCIRLLQALFPELERVILYGSRARGKFSETSDIDLAIDFGNGKKIENRRRLLEAKEVINELHTHYRCDLADYQTATGIFKEMIEEDGIIWLIQKSS